MGRRDFPGQQKQWRSWRGPPSTLPEPDTVSCVSVGQESLLHGDETGEDETHHL